MPRLARLLVLLAVCVLVAPAAASADPVPAIGDEWPKCFTGTDDDGRYCIVSAKKNGLEVAVPSSGPYQWPYVRRLGSGTVGFGVWHVDGSHQDTDVPPADEYELVVNSGAIRPRELFGNARDASFSRGGSPGSFTFTLRFKPTPVAWIDPFSLCVVGACGGSAMTANFLRSGFVTGYVTDLKESGLDAAEIEARTGYVHVYNAQSAVLPFYDVDTHALVIRLANPHLRSSGVPATGSYQTFLPNALLSGVMNVPDPGSLTGGTVAVSRTESGDTTAAPFTLVHRPGGVEIEIPEITYSSPTYRIRPKRTRPGPPRIRTVKRVTRTSVRVGFLRPLANGGAPVTRYVARCRTAAGRTFTAAAPKGPITVKVPTREVRCAVRAVNRIGKGPFSAEKRA